MLLLARPPELRRTLTLYLPSSGSALRAVGAEREVVVQLRTPLGGRVLVNLDGSAVEVLGLK